jgi:hypothetical protein
MEAEREVIGGADHRTEYSDTVSPEAFPFILQSHHGGLMKAKPVIGEILRDIPKGRSRPAAMLASVV